MNFANADSPFNRPDIWEKKMSTLPKWIEELKVGNNCGKAYQALEIAWESLEKIHSGENRIQRPPILVAQDAMRRIEEMGK